MKRPNNITALDAAMTLPFHVPRIRRAVPEPGRSPSFHALKPSLALLLITALFVVGCDTMNWQQYRVAGVGSGSPNAARLKAALQAIAEKTDLKDRTSDSRLPQTFVFFTQPGVRSFRVDIGARFYNHDALIDLVGGFGPTPEAYKQGKRLLMPALSAEFGTRVSIPEPFVRIQ